MQTSFNTNIPQAIPSKPVSHSLLYSPIESPSWAFPLSTICITINIIIIINLAAVTKFCSCTARYHPKPHQPSSIQPAIESARAGRHSLSLSWLACLPFPNNNSPGWSWAAATGGHVTAKWYYLRQSHKSTCTIVYAEDDEDALFQLILTTR